MWHADQHKILCLAGEPILKGLKLAVERNPAYSGKLEFFGASLAKMPENLAEFDLFFLALDLGQPVPGEHLKNLPARPGLCALFQPTPQQLLQLSERIYWNAMAWDGVSFDRVCERIVDLLEMREKTVQLERFVETSRLWLERKLAVPAFIEWANPPEKWSGATRFALESERRTLSVGGLQSRADAKVPLEANNDEVCEFRFSEGHWSLELLNKKAQTSFAGNATEIRAGDQLQIEDMLFHFKAPREIEEFLAILRRTPVAGEIGTPRPSGDKSLSELCREFMASWVTGELRVNSGLRHGSIFFIDGTIHHSICGAVDGVKALARMLGWENPTWRFNAGRKPDAGSRSMEIAFSDFDRIHRRWRDTWSRLKGFLPPPHLKLQGTARGFNKKEGLTSHEYQVLAAVCEYHLVRDIFNNCPLTDAEILAQLIEMRKQGLIEPMTAPAKG